MNDNEGWKVFNTEAKRNQSAAKAVIEKFGLAGLRKIDAIPMRDIMLRYKLNPSPELVLYVQTVAAQK